MEWYLSVLKNYAVFSGRARRKEYWMFMLFNIIVTCIIAVIDSAMGTVILGVIYALAVFIPSIGVSIRRLHDTNRSGWWLLIAFLPLIGSLVLLVFFVLEGTAGENSHGVDPKQVA